MDLQFAGTSYTLSVSLPRLPVMTSSHGDGDDDDDACGAMILGGNRRKCIMCGRLIAAVAAAGDTQTDLSWDHMVHLQEMMLPLVIQLNPVTNL